jgi:hypothetical protein
MPLELSPVIRALVVFALLPLLGACTAPVRGPARAVPEEDTPRAAGAAVRARPVESPPPAQEVTTRSVVGTEDEVREQVSGAQDPAREGMRAANEGSRADARRVEEARRRSDRRAQEQRESRLERERRRRAERHAEALAVRREAWGKDRPTQVEALVAAARARAGESGQSPREAAEEMAATLRIRAARWRQQAWSARKDADEAWQRSRTLAEAGARDVPAERRAVQADRRAHEVDALAAQAEVEAEWGQEAVGILIKGR